MTKNLFDRRTMQCHATCQLVSGNMEAGIVREFSMFHVHSAGDTWMDGGVVSSGEMEVLVGGNLRLGSRHACCAEVGESLDERLSAITGFERRSEQWFDESHHNFQGVGSTFVLCTADSIWCSFVLHMHNAQATNAPLTHSLTLPFGICSCDAFNQQSISQLLAISPSASLGSPLKFLLGTATRSNAVARTFCSNHVHLRSRVVRST